MARDPTLKPAGAPETDDFELVTEALALGGLKSEIIIWKKKQTIISHVFDFERKEYSSCRISGITLATVENCSPDICRVVSSNDLTPPFALIINHSDFISCLEHRALVKMTHRNHRVEISTSAWRVMCREFHLASTSWINFNGRDLAFFYTPVEVTGYSSDFDSDSLQLWQTSQHALPRHSECGHRKNVMLFQPFDSADHVTYIIDYESRYLFIYFPSCHQLLDSSEILSVVWAEVRRFVSKTQDCNLHSSIIQCAVTVI
ncbi:hypothetical protein PoB_007418300 [Plakobranchus ocellatus]|uniref:Uncharacterized protein n=1 Tax=Plakobranchus ocellatus TaxID=259542 RepID=A0AAV4DU91_9GAST|nr:hypothetical protein PoB_007418300 [Plakobranchus ocellatus]